ncbi:hypothetical protein MNBD_GAMMA10-2122 [hydrothermal vent metagenome]|uniref:Small-conductance mechanosensitive channel n=1 Tax=hydrothermal vent metagenome TaxID=652676 RepID=A0A3B0XC95_9ZZZZ
MIQLINPGLTLYLAAPVKVGDFCKFTDKMGTIEETGLRATKIRTLEHTVISVPNAEFAAMQIENLTERERYRYSPAIRLHYRTSPEQIRYILLNIKASLQAHSKIIDAPLRVNFTDFGEHSLDIEIHCYIDTVDIVEFKDISEDLNLHILDIIESAGSRMAIPASIEYHEQESVSLPDAKHQAEQRVETFRTNSKQ